MVGVRGLRGGCAMAMTGEAGCVMAMTGEARCAVRVFSQKIARQGRCSGRRLQAAAAMAATTAGAEGGRAGALGVSVRCAFLSRAVEEGARRTSAHIPAVQTECHGPL